VRLVLQAHQQVGAGAEGLHRRVGIAGLLQAVAHVVDVRRLVEAQLDAHAAGEVEREVEALGEHRAEGDEHQQAGDGQRDPPQAHEVDVAVVRENIERFHRCASRIRRRST
jgi:hypothetical protein